MAQAATGAHVLASRVLSCHHRQRSYTTSHSDPSPPPPIPSSPSATGRSGRRLHELVPVQARPRLPVPRPPSCSSLFPTDRSPSVHPLSGPIRGPRRRPLIMASVGKLDDEYEFEDFRPFSQEPPVKKLDEECEFEDFRPFSYEPPVKKLEDGNELKGLKPFFYDEATWVDWVVEERERVQRKKEEKERKEVEKERRAKAHKKVRDSIFEYDPKTDCKVFTRFFLRDFSVFDINEKSSIPPMRYADSKYKDDFGLEDSANILSISVVCSDEGFPVNVYGSIIARDSIDYKCIDLFHRNRDDCQPINREGGMLVLTGPGRGLVLVDFIYIEIDLKIKKDGVYPDKQFSKGLITIDGRVLSRETDVMVRSETLDSFHSTMEVRYATALNTVEATFEVKLVKGYFNGTITAGISGIKETIVIHDSQADGVVTCDESGVIKLRRRVMTICQSSRMLVFHSQNKAGGVVRDRTIQFTPQRPGVDEWEFWCGPGNLSVKVVWSLMDFRP